MGSYIESDYQYLPDLFSSLTDVLCENRQFYLENNGARKGEEFAQCFEELLGVTTKTLKLLLEVAAVSPLFDYDPHIKGNGYRTIVRVIEICFRRIFALGKDFQENRTGLFFRSDHHYKELFSYLQLSKGLFRFLEFTKLILEWSVGNDLFPPENCLEAKKMTERHLHEMEKECFYGRRLGFYFNSSLRRFLTTVSVVMASYGDGYANHDGSFSIAASSLLNGPKYLINPDLRAKKIISLITLVDVEFCKSFWCLTERYGLQFFPVVVGSSIKINELFEIPPIAINIKAKNGENLTIQPPSSWIGASPINVHLLSFQLRAGQKRDEAGTIKENAQTKTKADGLVIHLHGGGFVAQSSTSHEIYLRSWAKSLNVPILSVNYALAPELPFPRALEECTFAYIWALKNFDRLGTTGKYIALVGDSAGGNLSVSLCLKVASFGLRLPDGILACYAPFNVEFSPSPSRLLTLLDPLLPVGILTQCLAAYTGMSTGKSNESETKNAAGVSFGPDQKTSTETQSSGDISVDQFSNNVQTSNDTAVLPDLVKDSSSERSRMRQKSSTIESDISKNRKHMIGKSVPYVERPISNEELFNVTKNPFISPLKASDEQLATLPPLDLLACSLDPMFDDSIEFAKRLRSVGNKVELYIVDDLPHGFLNFYVVCQEAREANELCIACIKKILQGKRNINESTSPPIY